jgi:hypothetical protein
MKHTAPITIIGLAFTALSHAHERLDNLVPGANLSFAGESHDALWNDGHIDAQYYWLHYKGNPPGNMEAWLRIGTKLAVSHGLYSNPAGAHRYISAFVETLADLQGMVWQK